MKHMPIQFTTNNILGLVKEKNGMGKNEEFPKKDDSEGSISDPDQKMNRSRNDLNLIFG